MRLTTLVLVFLFPAGMLCAADAAKSAAPGLSPEEAAQGFVSLFDGKTLSGWQGDVKNHRVENGAIVRPRDAATGRRSAPATSSPTRSTATSSSASSSSSSPAPTTASASARRSKGTRPTWAWKSRSSTTATRCTRAFSRGSPTARSTAWSPPSAAT